MNHYDQIPQNNLMKESLIIRRFSSFSRARWVANGYLILLCIAEILVAFNAPQFGLLLHGIILIALLVHSSRVFRPYERRFLLVLSLTPLIRIISLITPFTLFPGVYQYAIVGIPLFVAAFLIARSAGISRYSAGLVIPSSFPFQLLVSFSGILLGYLEYVILKPASMESALTMEQIWLPALILLIFTGFLEELIFRGLMQTAAIPYLERYAIPYVALVFTVMHIGYWSIWDLIFVFCVALFFGMVAKRTGSILGVTLSHGLINIFLFLIFPLLLTKPASPQTFQWSLSPIGCQIILHTPTSIALPFAVEPDLQPISYQISSGNPYPNCASMIEQQNTSAFTVGTIVVHPVEASQFLPWNDRSHPPIEYIFSHFR